MNSNHRQQLLKLIKDQLKATKRSYIKIWWKDADGIYDEANLEIDDIEVIDGLNFEWGCDEIEGKFSRQGLFMPSAICNTPRMHRFESKMLLQPYRQCKDCGYSPELDSGKKEYQEVHKDFIEFEKRNKTP